MFDRIRPVWAVSLFVYVFRTGEVCAFTRLAFSTAAACESFRTFSLNEDVSPRLFQSQSALDRGPSLLDFDPSSPAFDSSTNKKITLIPLSSNPLLFVSSEPILSKQECQTLSQWCRAHAAPGQASLTVSKSMLSDLSPAAQKLTELRRKIQYDLLGLTDDNGNDDNVMPRYLHYPEGTEEYTPLMDAPTLLPDGLHVDTNNNMHFRHW